MATGPSGKGFGRNVAISEERGCLIRGRREIRLRAKTFQVLLYLHEHHGRLVTKDELLGAVWPGTFVSDDSLTKCVGEIRQALGDDEHQLLKTVARRGFILDAPLQAAGPAAGEVARHNLPAPLTSFIGRGGELAEFAQLLPSTRLLTLTGAGGCGKTRLALEIARQTLEQFPDGAWLADLTPLGEARLVVQTVASVLDIRQAPNRTLLESMTDQLRHRRVLLILDNCEHVIATAAELAATLLRSAAGLTILATSREALGIDGETRRRVPSLASPDPQHVAGAADLLGYEAVRLLVDRAAAVDSTFAITKENARTAAEVCRRLDGIPLAIELAAARLKVLSIEQIHDRLDDRFQLLTRTDRKPIGRQRTLEATVAWSYDLLADVERQLLRRLSAFAGGWTLEAAEHVCADGGIDCKDVLDLMTRLVDKSLVLVDDDAAGGRRYRFLETVRHFARERLLHSGEADLVRARHFECFLQLALRAEPELTKQEQLVWLDRLQHEHDNLRAALEWRLWSHDPGPEGLELAAALHWFWLKRAHFAEGQHWLERTIATATRAAPARRAHALMALGSVVFFQGDFERALLLLEDSTAQAVAAGETSVAALALGLQTMAALEGGDHARAARCAVASRDAALAAGDPWLECFSVTYFAYAALYEGDVNRASELHERAVALARAQGDLWALAIVLFDLALLRVLQHRYSDARALCGEGIGLGRRNGDQRAVAWHLGVLAGADASEGHALRAAHLRGAMEGLLDSVGSAVQPTYKTLIDDPIFGAVQQQLGADAYARALAAGRAMSLTQAVQYADPTADG